MDSLGMGRLGQWLRAFLPRRRLRAWRYVSPRRHGAGMAVLLVLVCALYAYWTLTNDEQVRREARAYLAELTGADLRVREARFSLFGGVELEGVELRVPGEEAPFFQARSVVLRHRPWGLLVRRQLDVAEISCTGAVVDLVWDAATNQWNYGKLRFSGGGAGGEAGALPSAWPRLALPQARVFVTRRNDSNLCLRWLASTADIIGLSRGGNSYLISLEDQGPDANARIQGSVRVNTVTGQIVASSRGFLNNELFQQFSRLQSMGIRGPVAVDGRWDPAGGQWALDANLSGAAFDLPPELGGLHLHSVHGAMSFDANGITVERLTGQVAEAGDARFTVAGRYAGYEANSPFDANLMVKAVRLPARLDGNGMAANLVDYINRHYLAKSPLNVAMRLARAPDGRFTVEGTVDGNGLTLMDKSFPYVLHDAEMEANFTDRQMEMRLRGTHGTAKIEIQGRVFYPPEGKTFDIRVQARDLAFDEDLYAALAPADRALWDQLRPRGLAAAQVRTHVDSPGAAEAQEVTVSLGGGASVEYEGFPYRVDNVYGEVHVAGDRIDIRGVTGGSEAMNCTVNGSVRRFVEANCQVDITVDARVPLDDKLRAALGPQGTAAFAALRPAGTAQRVRAHVWHEPGEELQFRVRAALEGASFRFDRFPYTVTDAAGTLLFEPNRVTIQSLEGRHGTTPIHLSGTVFYDANDVGVDLRVDANAVNLDAELLAAVPPAVQRVWERLSPAGLADVSFQVRWMTLDDPNAMDYTCLIRARDARLKYADFPYPFRGVTGVAEVTPGLVKLRDMSATDGRMKVLFNGRVTSDANQDVAELSIRAEDVPVNSDLLAALPTSVGMLSRLKPGGTVNLDLRRLVLVSPSLFAASAPAAATGAATAPATAPSPIRDLTEWRIEGEVGLRDAEIELGIPVKVTGGLAGLIARTPKGLQIDANLRIASLSLNRRVMTDLRGRLWKPPASDVIRVEDFLGKAYGGRLAGFGEVRLGEPFQYGFRVFAENVNLRELYNAAADPNQPAPMEGLLDVTVELKATEGNQPTRQATGLLHLAKGKAQQVPVVVDLIQPIFLVLPGDSPFSEGLVEYTLQNDKLSFREIHLRGPGYSIVGSGTMNMKNEALKLTFLGRPGILPRLGSLGDEFVEGIMRELVEIQVTGTLKKPRFRSVPLRSLESILQKLVRPDAE